MLYYLGLTKGHEKLQLKIIAIQFVTPLIVDNNALLSSPSSLSVKVSRKFSLTYPASHAS